jgi:hypothetical protein
MIIESQQSDIKKVVRKVGFQIIPPIS